MRLTTFESESKFPHRVESNYWSSTMELAKLLCSKRTRCICESGCNGSPNSSNGCYCKASRLNKGDPYCCKSSLRLSSTRAPLLCNQALPLFQWGLSLRTTLAMVQIFWYLLNHLLLIRLTTVVLCNDLHLRDWIWRLCQRLVLRQWPLLFYQGMILFHQVTMSYLWDPDFLMIWLSSDNPILITSLLQWVA